jgi:hypothetical protein
MWCLPTHKRPEKLRRLVDSLGRKDAEEHVIVMMWKDDPRLQDYSVIALGLPRNWDVWISDRRLCGEKMNALYEAFPQEDFYGFLSDDVQIGTKGMLALLRESAQDGKFAWPNDGIHGVRNSTHPVAPGDMIRAMGFWAHPRFLHNGLDTVLYRVANALSLCDYKEELKLIVQHPTATGHVEEDDDTYREARELNQKAIDDMYDFEERELAPFLEKVKMSWAKAHEQRV